MVAPKSPWSRLSSSCEETDSTIPPPPKKKPAIFFSEHFMAAIHEEGCFEKSILKHFHVCNGLSDDDVGEGGVCRGTPTVFQKIRPGERWFQKPAISLRQKFGGLP